MRESEMSVWDRVECFLVATTWWLVFVYSSYLITKTYGHIYQIMSYTIRTLVTEGMYYGLTFPRVKEYKTIQNELTTTYLLSE